MKNPILSFFGILCVTQAAHTADLSPGSFTYKPPAGYGCFGLHHDPGDSPFSQEGPGCQYLSNDQHSSVIFRLCLVRLPVGNPAPGAFTSSVESALQKRIAAASAGLSNRSAIMIHRQAELPTVSVSGTVRKTADVPLRELLVGMRWVHIQSNLVLKITAVSPHMSAFSSLTNSLVSMQVDRARLLESITPELLAPFAPPDIEFEGKDVVTWLRELIGMSETGPPRLSEDVQRRAADAIKRMSTREFDYLAESLPSVRTDRLLSEAIVLAFKVSSTNAAGTVTKLTRLLAGEENTARNAIRCLGYVGAASVNSLSQALTDKDARVRQNAAAALGEIGPAAGIVVPLLIERAKTDGPPVQLAALDALARVHQCPDKVIPLLVKNLGNPDGDIRACCASAISSFALSLEVEAAVPSLFNALVDTDASVRNNAAAALMHIPLGADTIPKLTAELSNPDPRVRSIIAQTLGKQGTNAATAIPVLLSLTNDSDRYVQESATVALKQIGYRLSPSK